MKISSENILNEFAAFTRTLTESKEPKFISFAFHLEQIDALSLINNLNKHFDNIFIFRTPNNKLTVYGLNTALELTSNKIKNFTSLTDYYDYWKHNFIFNWNDK